METSHHSLLTIGIALMVGVIGQSLARHLRFPAIILLLALGAAMGPEGLGWVEPRSLGAGLFALVEMGVAVILFEGGLNLQASRLRRQERPIRYLVTLGSLVTLVFGALMVKFILDWSWPLSFLFGSLVVVTGPTVVTPLLRDMRLHPRLKTILEAEGVLIDPVGAILAMLVLQIVLAPSGMDSMAKEMLYVGYRLGFGILAGVAGGLLLGGMLKVKHLVPHGLENIFALAFVLMLFTGCEAVIKASGIMAVTVAGFVVGWLGTSVDKELREFKDQLTLLLVGLLFILLAADVRIKDIKDLGTPGIWLVVSLIIIVRPLCVWLCTSNSNLTFKEKLFMGWVAPRGIIAAAIASLTADTLTEKGLEGGNALRGLVFLTIITTVVLAGLTAKPMASLLKLRLPGRNRVAILGAEGIGLVLGDELKRQGVPVVFLDTDPRRCSNAENRGHLVVLGDALEDRTLNRAQFELVGTAIGLTANDHLNSLFIGNARELFRVPLSLVSVETLPDGGLPQHVRKHEAEVLFDGPHDLKRWDVRLRHNDIRVEQFTYEPPKETPKSETDGTAPTSAEAIGKKIRAFDSYAILVIKRGDKAFPMYQGFKLKKGDIASVAIYKQEEVQAMQVLNSKNWKAYQPVASKETTAVVPQAT